MLLSVCFIILSVVVEKRERKVAENKRKTRSGDEGLVVAARKLKYVL
jgi:hypothetical protein